MEHLESVLAGFVQVSSLPRRPRGVDGPVDGQVQIDAVGRQFASLGRGGNVGSRFDLEKERKMKRCATRVLVGICETVLAFVLVIASYAMLITGFFVVVFLVDFLFRNVFGPLFGFF